mmetsp:Transcript_134881/g.234478  ORF Transcript_134881/g.234478 Transcript_134881/m.234478 type:complete len:231 (+) Transcript_134881:62-754(+)
MASSPLHSLSDFANSFKAVEDRGLQHERASEAATTSIAERLQVLAQGLEELGLSREALGQRTTRQIRVLEESSALEFSAAKQARRDSEAKAVAIQDAHLRELRMALRTETLARERALGELTRVFGQEAVRLSGDLERLQRSRIAQGEHLAAELDARLEKIRIAVSTESQLRLEAESTLVRRLDDITSQILDEVVAESQVRKEAQGQFLAVLEDACGRAERTFPVRHVATN